MLDSVAPLVVVATRGRPAEIARLLASLTCQTRLPQLTVVVGADATDLPERPSPGLRVDYLIAPGPGSTRQRNLGLAHLRRLQLLTPPGRTVVFFDDDFRPAPDWLERAEDAFATTPALVGLTGLVLGDGVGNGGLSETQATDLIEARTQPAAHWSHVAEPKDVESLYGCNMAFLARVAQSCDFDEALPLYGWQEDCDYTGQARRLGRTQIRPTCRGVHLGAVSARVSGVRMGYSQIANPLRIASRGNMTRLRMLRFLGKAVLANVAKSIPAPARVDYRGRLQGNLHALIDLLRNRCRPERVLDLQAANPSTTPAGQRPLAQI